MEDDSWDRASERVTNRCKERNIKSDKRDTDLNEFHIHLPVVACHFLVAFQQFRCPKKE